MMRLLNQLFSKAPHHNIYLWLLNRVLHFVIPFNKPHQITITALEKYSTSVRLPLKRKNKNHLGGMHACALATACEYVCGITLIRNLAPDKFRLILKSLTIEYEHQARTDLNIHFELPEDSISNIITQLTKNGVYMETFTVNVTDNNHKPICNASVTWQLKAWKLVGKKLTQDFVFYY